MYNYKEWHFLFATIIYVCTLPLSRQVVRSNLAMICVLKNVGNNALFTISSRVNALGRTSVHAECNLIGKMQNSTLYGTENNRKKKKMYDIIVYRKNINGYAMAKPCVSCAIMIASCGFIKNVYYSTNNGDFEHCKSNNITENAKFIRSQIINNNMISSVIHSKRAVYVKKSQKS